METTPEEEEKREFHDWTNRCQSVVRADSCVRQAAFAVPTIFRAISPLKGALSVGRARFDLWPVAVTSMLLFPGLLFGDYPLSMANLQNISKLSLT